MKYKIKNTKEKISGITLIALVVTIILLLILAGVSINSIISSNGIMVQSNRVKIMTELGNYKESLNLYILSKKMENVNFSHDSLTAGKCNLFYNTKPNGESGNIKTIIPDINSYYLEKIEIVKGELLLYTTDEETIDLATSLDIKINPYNIINGELKSTSKNLTLVDSLGTLTIPDSVKKVGEGAFSNISGLRQVIIPRYC